MSDGLSDGISDGISEGVTDGTSDGISDGLELELLDGEFEMVGFSEGSYEWFGCRPRGGIR